MAGPMEGTWSRLRRWAWLGVEGSGVRQATAFLAGGGEMGERIRAYPWAKHPLGPPEQWPQALRTVVRLMLNTGHPIFIFWGPEHFCFYNDAYYRSIGPERHPVALGKRGREVWDEIWDIIGPQIDQVMSGGAATWHENALVPITRHGKREDVYWTYSYGPIDDDTARAGVGGVLVVVTETTAVVRTQEALRVSEDRLRQATEAAEIGTWDFNPVTGDLRWDARCKELFGLSPAAHVTYETAFLAGLHPDDRERTHAAVQAALNGGGAYDIEYRTIGLEDGVERWIAATGKAIFEDGKAVRFVGTVLDISERKIAEQRFEIINNVGAALPNWITTGSFRR
jgi:PAS domain S-box-containing protein